MKIAIDLRALQIGHQYRGIGAYITNVVGRFPFDSTEHTFVILRYSESSPVEGFNLPLREYEEVVMTKPPEAHGLKKLAQIVERRVRPKFGNLSAHKPDVFFQPDFLLGLPRSRRIKKYVVMYDIIPLVLREMYLPSWKRLVTKPGLGKRRRLRIILSAWLKENHYMRSVRSVRRADRIFSISDATARDLHDYLGIPKSKVKTIPLAPSVPRIETSETHRPKQLSDIKNPYLLFVGGIDGRRRLVDLVHAFNVLNGRGHTFDLVLSGKELVRSTDVPNKEVREAILESSYKSQIHLLGFTSQEEKAWLLQHAFAFVYPTLYEGFGLPILEAMVQGCPAITYKNSSIPEVAGKAAILLDEQSGTAIFKAVVDLAANESFRERVTKDGVRQAKQFNWDTCANVTFESLTKR